MKEEILRGLFPTIWEEQNQEAANAQKVSEILRQAVKDSDLMDMIQERACIRWSDGYSDSLYMAVLSSLTSTGETVDKDNNGKTVLMYAVGNDKARVDAPAVKELLAHKININETDIALVKEIRAGPNTLSMVVSTQASLPEHRLMHTVSEAPAPTFLTQSFSPAISATGIVETWRSTPASAFTP